MIHPYILNDRSNLHTTCKVFRCLNFLNDYLNKFQRNKYKVNVVCKKHLVVKMINPHNPFNTVRLEL